METTQKDFWERRTTHDINVLFNDPALLWEAACSYFSYCKQNPAGRSVPLRHIGMRSPDRSGNIWSYGSHGFPLAQVFFHRYTSASFFNLRMLIPPA